MTLPAYARDPGSREVTDHSKIEEAFRQGLPPGFGPVKLSISYAGRDAKGFSVYRISYQVPEGAGKRGGTTQTQTMAFTGQGLVPPSKITKVSDPGDFEPEGPPTPPNQAATPVEAMKIRILNWLADNGQRMPEEQLNNAKSFVQRTNDLDSLRMFFNNLEPLPLEEGIHAEFVPDETGFDPTGGLTFDFGSGTGTGAEYVKPDRRTVEDLVKGQLVSLVGNVPSEDMVQQFTDLYMQDHRRNFDNPTDTIEPAQSVVEAIRNTDTYKAIHELRPESEDERAWVSERREAAAKGGLTTGQREDFAITQATVGGDVDDVVEAASTRQFKRSGSARGTLIEDKIRGVTQAMFSRVR